ncbi:MAG: hydroxyacid dehydrogenase, partial [Verrucomicrobia bacterium]|nr:hydroxyacid dehydrogenase [Verrucomicrobiota bacterium]
MKTILFTNKYTGTLLDIVNSEVPDGFDICFLSEQTQEALVSQVSDAEYIIAGGRLKISREVLEQAGKLKMIQRSG